MTERTSRRIHLTVRNTFIAGLLVLIPILLTAKALWWLFLYVDELSQPIAESVAGRPVRGVGLLITVGLIFAAGLLFSRGPLRRLLDAAEDVLDDVPVVGTVYGTTKKVLSGFRPESESAFQRFVFARLPGRLMPAFVTGSVILQEDGGERTLVAVYIPTNHLYVGDVVFLEPGDVIATELTVEDGIGLVLSAGTSIPARLSRLP